MSVHNVQNRPTWQSKRKFTPPFLSLALPSLPSFPAIRGQHMYLLYCHHTKNILIIPMHYTPSHPYPFINLPNCLHSPSTSPSLNTKLSSSSPSSLLPPPSSLPFLASFLILAALLLFLLPLLPIILHNYRPGPPSHLAIPFISSPRSISTALLPPPDDFPPLPPPLLISTSPANPRRRNLSSTRQSFLSRGICRCERSSRRSSRPTGDRKSVV